MIPRSIIGKHIETGEYGCLKCKYYDSENYRCWLEECMHGNKNKYIPPKKEKHRCQGCVWGKNTGGKIFCMLPRCMPKLGNFGKGVIKDEKQKNLHQDAT